MKAAQEVRAIWIRPFAVAFLALLVALGVVLLATITNADRAAETERLRRQSDEQSAKIAAQDSQIAQLRTQVGDNQAAADCRSRAVAAYDEADGTANDFLRQSLIDRVVAGVPIPERSGEMLRLNASAKAARDKRVEAATACTLNPNFVPK